MKTGRIIKNLVFIICLFIFLPVRGSATHYYVDNVNGSDTNSGTSTSSPWKTIACVNSKMSQLVPGDIVSFKRGGTWTDRLYINKSGVAGNPITFNAYGTGNKPIIRNPTYEPSYKMAIYVKGSYVVIENLMIRDTVDKGIDLYGNHCVVRNCEITNVGVGVEVWGQYNLITKNYMHHLILVVNTPTPTYDDYGAEAVGLRNTDNEVSYNRAEYNLQNSYDYPGGLGQFVDLFYNTSRSYIHHNYVYRCHGFLEAGTNVPRTVYDVRIEYNVTFDSGRFTGINNAVGDYQVTPENWRVQNNTIVDTNNSPTWARDAAIVFDAVGKSGQFIFRNNILYFEGWNRIAKRWTTFDHDHNLIYFKNPSSDTYNITPDATDILRIDPKFLNLAAGDLHLASDSPARDKGVVLGYSGIVDFDGNSVPYGSAPDIGAYEYVSSGTALSANASASPTSGQAPLAVSFTGGASGGSSPYSYRWAFGDGGSSTSRNPSHTYSSAGTYTASLTVTDSASATASKSLTITVTATTSSLAASASASPTSGQAPLAVNFTGSATGGTSPYSYSWNFGDGTSSTSKNPSHTYSTAGTYTAILTVTDLNFASAGATVNITVGETSTTATLSLAAQTGAPAPGEGGTTDPSPGNHSYSFGSTVSVKSIAYKDFRFSRWTGDIAESSLFNSTSALTMDSDRSLTATFCTKCADVNGDLEITPADAQLAFDIYLGKVPSPTWCELENADVDCSGTKLSPKITPGDAQAIFNIYLKKGMTTGECSGNSRAAEVSTQTADFKNANLTIDNMAFTTDLDILIPIIIECPSEVTAFGFDLTFPSNALTFIRLERSELTNSYDQLDASVMPYLPINQEQASAKIAETLVLRVGGYKTNPDQSPSLGVLVTLVFRGTGEFIDPGTTSIIATYDDLQHASVINRIINHQDHSQIREKMRQGKSV